MNKYNKIFFSPHFVFNCMEGQRRVVHKLSRSHLIFIVELFHVVFLLLFIIAQWLQFISLTVSVQVRAWRACIFNHLWFNVYCSMWAETIEWNSIKKGKHRSIFYYVITPFYVTINFADFIGAHRFNCITSIAFRYGCDFESNAHMYVLVQSWLYRFVTVAMHNLVCDHTFARWHMHLN